MEEIFGLSHKIIVCCILHYSFRESKEYDFRLYTYVVILLNNISLQLPV